MEIKKTNSLQEAIAECFDKNVSITGKHPVYGGDINDSYRLSLSDGTSIFMKCNSMSNLSFFEAEIKGLEALGKTETIGVPKAFGIGTDSSQRTSFLLMEHLDSAPRTVQYWEIFGSELAMLHRADSSSFTGEDTDLPFGFDGDNYIGATPQINTPKGAWITFFRDCRLAPQMKMAEHYFDSRLRKKCIKLLERLDAYLVEPEFPSLLHGDLWSGNALCGPDGKAWILDPAVYVGHFEADLAMTELFGNYPSSFYDSYSELNKIDSGYRDRKDLYNLYHLLNHLNLFGGSYGNSVRSIIDRYI